MSGNEPALPLVSRGTLRIFPDHRRVIAVLFVPGEEMPRGDSRAVSVTERILAMDAGDVTTTLADLKRRFGHRHRHLEDIWLSHFRLASRRLGDGDDVPAEKKLLTGAYFTRELSLEGAALFNPSVVAHPDQSGLAPGEARFVMSLRAIGEGHISSIEFRTGTVDGAGEVRLDDPGKFVGHGHWSPGPYNKRLFHAKLAERGCDNQAATLVLDRLDPVFGPADLDLAISSLHSDLLSRAAVRDAVVGLRWVAANNYAIEFPTGTQISERVLWPHGPAEAQGMEDARFVRFVGDDGGVTYFATYTAFDHALIAPQLLTTTDFRTFRISQFSGPFATNKGMALFPRKVGGQYVALSRWDRERLAITTSDDLSHWDQATTLPLPTRPWDLVQVGNCGSPLETVEGWLVLTHGVGPMREYSIGAILLGLDDPRRVIGTLTCPLLVANEDEREGYVPNVVYSCGALAHGKSIVLPYGFSDSAVGFARVDMAGLLRLIMTGAPESVP
ncbi:MAG TPA: glycoside hydrolase family 130 protein [Acidimicrobiales bacterium]|nr:glycoside hydrolase family 130 protein [Acidimicrobiales bacterium]